MEKSPTISLCMIVKNEENMIERCLKSVAEIVDEIIIVDTGCTDKTIERCKPFNAKVISHKWDNHFAHARNESVKHATGDWIFILDADEELDENAKQLLKESVLQTDADFLYLPIINYFGKTFPVNRSDAFVHYQARLFRRSLNVQFKNRIHEIATFTKDPKKADWIDASIHHYGYLTDIEENKKKSERNLEILQSADLEEDPWIAYHLASEYYRRQQYVQAFQYVNEAIVRFIIQQVKPPAILYRLKYAILIETNSIEGASRGIERAIELYPDYVDLHYCKGYILYKKGEYKKALLAFNTCLQLGEENYNYITLKGAGSFRALHFKEKCLEHIQKDEHHFDQREKKILYIGWLGYNNLGDELMYELFKKEVAKLDGNFTVDFVCCEKKYLDHAPYHNFDLIVLGGGSILNGRDAPISSMIIEFLYKAVDAGKKVMMWGTGIDWIPKSGLEALKNGQDDRSLTIDEQLKEKVKTVFEKSEWLGVRGPLTMNVLHRLGIREGVQMSGDPAFLLNSGDKTITSFDKKRKTIGVNWGTSFNNVYGANEERVENELVHALTALMERGYTVYLYNVWDQDIQAAQRLFNKLNRRNDVIFDQNMYGYEQLIRIIKGFDFTINFKLHANYLSLAAKVPFIALGYRFKVYDFVYSIGLEDQLVEMDSMHIREEILRLEKMLMETKENRMKRMQDFKNMYAFRLLEPFRANLFL